LRGIFLPKPQERIVNVQPSVIFLEPIHIDSFVRHKLLRLFIKSGMDDFQSQILLSIILHGGQIKPKTLAKDIDCNPSRLELPDGFPSLLKMDLITMSHTRPKTAILAIGIDELLDRLATRTLVSDNLLKTKDAIDILFKLDEYDFKDESNSSGEFDEFLYVLNYYNHLERLSTKLPSLLSLLFFVLSSLWMNPSEAIVLTKLITSGGKISKKEFFETHIQNISLENLQENSRHIKETLDVLGYNIGQVEDLNLKFVAFYSNNNKPFKFSGEQQLNMTLNNLQEFCQSTSMGEKAGKRKFRNLTLNKSISQIADSLNRSFTNFQKQIKLDLQILKLAYSNVKLIDRDIYLSTISDPSSTRKRIETDIKYVTIISLSILHTYLVEDLFLKIFDSDNINFKLNIIASLEEKEVFINLLQKHKLGIQGKRGILESDTITFVPPDEIPQDVLIGNTIILLYKNNSSMIIIHEEITKENPTEINTISNDVKFAYKSFNKIIRQYVPLEHL
jgi:hypothetical protein